MRPSTNTALIVDDDEFFRMALRTVLTSTLGFSHVLEAENFDQAAALLSEKKIDLAVFDLIMPGMAGPGSLKGVRERFPDLCLVMATGSNRREDILLALQAGVNGYIPKSLGLKEFSSALKQIRGYGLRPGFDCESEHRWFGRRIRHRGIRGGRDSYPAAERRSHARCERQFEQGNSERTRARRGNSQSPFGLAVSNPRRPQPLRGCRQRRSYCF